MTGDRPPDPSFPIPSTEAGQSERSAARERTIADHTGFQSGEKHASIPNSPPSLWYVVLAALPG